MVKLSIILILVCASITSFAEEDADYFKDLRHYYQYDKSIPLQVKHDKLQSTGRTSVFTFRSHDGETIYATVTQPANYNPARKYPLFIGDKTLLSDELIAEHEIIVADISLRLQGKAARQGLSNSDGSAPFATIWARLNTVIDYRRLLDYIEGHYQIDTTKVIAGGRSRWGRILTILAANDDRIKGVIAASTSADWLATMKSTQFESFRKTMDAPWFNETFYRQIMAPIDPKYFARFVNVPVLVLHGEKDVIVRLDGAIRLQQALGSNATLITYADVGHHIASGFISKDVQAWVKGVYLKAE